MRKLAIFSTGAFVLAAPALAFAAPSQANFEASCSACHQVTGMGIPGAFPALAGNGFVQGPAQPVIATVLNGRGGMPAFKGDLDDDTLASILSYVRSAWGNKGTPVEAADVAAVRSGAAPAPEKTLQAH